MIDWLIDCFEWMNELSLEWKKVWSLKFEVWYKLIAVIKLGIDKCFNVWMFECLNGKINH